MTEHNSDIDQFFQNRQTSNFHQLLDRFNVLNLGHHAIAVPSNAPSEIIKGVFAVITAYDMRYKSLDYVMKQYGDEWDEEIVKYKKEKDLFDEISEVISKEVNEIVHWVDSIEEKPSVFGLFLANGALARLQSSFRSAQLLIRLGYTFEASALCRMILEQIAWAYSVHEIKDEVALKVSPSKSITKLKDFIPNAGNTYGFLNKFTHIDPSLMSQYLSIDGDGKFSIVLSSTDQKMVWGVFLLGLTDLYSVVYEYIFRNVAMSFSRIERKNESEYFPLATRKMSAVVQKYITLTAELEKFVQPKP